jgi:hypothetical protein
VTSRGTRLPPLSLAHSTLAPRTTTLGPKTVQDGSHKPVTVHAHAKTVGEASRFAECLLSQAASATDEVAFASEREFG